MKDSKLITSTELKFKEATFFLNQLKLIDKKCIEEFDFYLNAFITSARSVTWIMKAEFSKKPDFIKWYDSYEVRKNHNKYLKIFNDFRVQTTKIKPVKTVSRVVLTFPEMGNERAIEKFEKLQKSNLGIKYTAEFYSSNERGDRLQNEKDIHLTRVKFADIHQAIPGYRKNIIGMCNDYRLILKRLVEECVKKFVM